MGNDEMTAGLGTGKDSLISVMYVPHLAYVTRGKTVASPGGERRLVDAVPRAGHPAQIGAPLAKERLFLVPIDSLFRIPRVLPEEGMTPRRRERREVLQHWNSIIIYPKERSDWWLRGVPEHPLRSHFDWPVDVAMTTGRERSFLVFPLASDAGRLRPLSELMVNLDDGRPPLEFGQEIADHRNLRIALARSLVEAWGQLRSCGYCYGCYDSSNIFYDPKAKEVRFGFSMATRYLPDGDAESPSPIAVSKGVRESLIFDYIDPVSYGPIREAVDHGEQPSALLSRTDDFAMWAMAFRLLVGRLPFYGPSALTVPNTSGEDHLRWIDQYQKNAVFIFDSTDDSNQVGGRDGFAGEEVFRENWEAIPDDLRGEMFDRFDSGGTAAAS